MKTALAALFALGAAALFGTSTVLQQSAAQREADLPLLGLGVFHRVLRRPRWLAAIGLSVVSFAVQALALSLGPLVFVQPIAAMDLLFALPMLARRRRVHLRVMDWLGSIMVVGGVAAFLALSPPSAGRTEPGVLGWAAVLAGVAGVVVVALPVAMRSGAVMRTALLAGAGSAVFALVDALTKAFVGALGALGAQVLVRWQPYALLAAGLAGIALGQAAYRSGSLLVSLPVIDTVEPVGAVLIGTTAFGEHIARSPVVLGPQVGVGLVAVAGIAILARSPLIASG